VLFGVVAVSLYLLLPKLLSTRENVSSLADANPWWLLTALIAEIGAFLGYAMLSRFVFSLLNVFLSLWLTLRIVLAGFAASRIFSIGGIGGYVFTYSALAKRGVSRSIAVVAIAAQQFFVYIVLWLIFAISLVYLSTHGRGSGGTTVVAIIFITMILGGLIYFIYLYFHPTQLRRRSHQFVAGLNRIRKNKIDAGNIDDWVDNVRAGIRPMVGRSGRMWKAAMFALMYWGCDILCLFLVFQAFDYTVPLLALLVAYSIAYTVGTFAPTPGGLGAIEALLITTFAVMGVRGGVAIPAVLVYRLINYWLPLPIGTLSYFTVRGGRDKLGGEDAFKIERPAAVAAETPSAATGASAVETPSAATAPDAGSGSRGAGEPSLEAGGNGSGSREGRQALIETQGAASAPEQPRD